jgi:hypothetical protein
MKSIGRASLVGVGCLAVLGLVLVAKGRSAEQAALAKELPPLIRALPRDTVFAAALTDLDRFRADLKDTVFNDLWQDPNMKLWRERSWPKFKALFAEKTGLTIEEIDNLIHGDLLLVVTIPAGDDQPPRPAVALMARPTTNRGQFEATVVKLLDRLGLKATKVWAGDVLIIAGSPELARELTANLKAARPAPAGDKAFEAMRGRYAPGAFAHVWVNGQRLVSMLAKSAPKLSRAMLEQAGVLNLKGLYVAMAIRDRGVLTTGNTTFEGERKGLFALFGENAPSKAVRLVPADADNFFMIRHAGADKILSAIRAIALAAPDANPDAWKQLMADLGQRFGIDLEQDLPRLLGNELALSLTGGIGLNTRANLYVQSSDPDFLIATAERLLGQTPLQPAPAIYMDTAYKYSPAIPVPIPLQVSYGRVGDFVVVSSQQTGVRDAIAAFKSKKSLADSPRYTEAMARAGEPGWSESFSMLGPELIGLYSLLAPRFMMPMMREGRRAPGGIGPADLPNIVVLLDHQSPTVGRSRTRPDEIESVSYSTIGGGLDVSMAGVLAAVAVPRFYSAAQQSGLGRTRTDTARADMRSMATASEAYMVDWNTYPPYAVGKGSINAMIAPNSPAALLPTWTRSLTTPVAYITTYIRDPLAPGRTGGNAGPTYLYWAGPVGKDPSGKPFTKNSYLIVGAGPDGDYDIDGQWESLDPSVPANAQRLVGGVNKNGSAFTYDPTNGAVSNGDLWRAGGASEMAKYSR